MTSLHVLQGALFTLYSSLVYIKQPNSPFYSRHKNVSTSYSILSGSPVLQGECRSFCYSFHRCISSISSKPCTLLSPCRVSLHSQVTPPTSTGGLGFPSPSPFKMLFCYPLAQNTLLLRLSPRFLSTLHTLPSCMMTV